MEGLTSAPDGRRICWEPSPEILDTPNRSPGGGENVEAELDVVVLACTEGEARRTGAFHDFRLVSTQGDTRKTEQPPMNCCKGQRWKQGSTADPNQEDGAFNDDEHVHRHNHRQSETRIKLEKIRAFNDEGHRNNLQLKVSTPWPEERGADQICEGSEARKWKAEQICGGRLKGRKAGDLFNCTWTRAPSAATVTTLRSLARGAPMAGLLKILYNQRRAPFPTRPDANARARREGARGQQAAAAEAAEREEKAWRDGDERRRRR
jgi:hypothetical protein